MVRRSFRLGLRLGLLVGVIVAMVKLAQSRRSAREETLPPAPSGAAWPPFRPDPPRSQEPPAEAVVAEPEADPVEADPVEAEPVEAEAVVAEPEAVVAEPEAEAVVADVEAVPEPFVGDSDPEDVGTDSAPGRAVPPMDPAPAEADQPRDTPAAMQLATSETTTTAAAARAKAAARVEKRVAKTTRKAPAKKAASTTGASTTAPARAKTGPVSAPGDGAEGPPPAKTRVRRRRRQPWVEPLGHDTPTSHPVKAKLSSMLYHLPGMAFYERTRPDRCYLDAESAEADGFIRAKR